MKRRPRFVSLAALAAVVLGFAVSGAARADDFWGKWPDNADPHDVGQRIVANFLNRPTEKSSNGKVKRIGYPEACTAYGSLRFVSTIHDQDQQNKLIAKYENVVIEDAPGSRLNKPTGVDATVCSIVPFELYLLTGKETFRDAGKALADAQFDRTFAQDHFKIKADDYLAAEKNGGTHPPEGLSWQTRYWVDDMFMITGTQMQAYRATKDHVYLDHAAAEMVSYLDKLQQPNGLFYHSPTAPYFWGRGNGWFAVGMAEVLQDMPEDHPQRARILDGYKKMMTALKQDQAPEGYWRQLIDDDKSWGESSCTGMFTFAMGMGVRHGWLDDSYKEPAKKAWIAMTKFLDKDANVTEVCVGTNRNKDRQFYLDRPREIGNLHGQAAAIWAAWPMLNP